MPSERVDDGLLAPHDSDEIMGIRQQSVPQQHNSGDLENENMLKRSRTKTEEEDRRQNMKTEDRKRRQKTKYEDRRQNTKTEDRTRRQKNKVFALPESVAA